MDCVLSRPIYSYPSIINLMYYYTKVLLSRNYSYYQKCYGKKSEQRSAYPNALVPNLTMRGLYQGVGVHLSKVSLLKVVQNLAMRCLYWGWDTSDQRSTKLGHEMSLPGDGLGAGVGVSGQGWGRSCCRCGGRVRGSSDQRSA